MVKIKDILKLLTYVCVLTGYASVARYIGLGHTGVFLALLAFAVYCDIREPRRIPTWALNCASVGVLGLAAFQVRADYLVEPILDALPILTAIKLLGEKRFRDYLQIYMLCIFLLIGSSLMSVNGTFAIYFTTLALLSTAALILLAYFAQDPEIALHTRNVKTILSHALFIGALSIPIGAMLFVILPRTNYPLFQFLQKNASAKSGFSDEVELGSLTDIQEDNSVIMRVQMPRVGDGDLYWRGVVLDTFNGISWKSSNTDSGPWMHPLEGNPIPQTIYLEPYGNRYLFALDLPVSLRAWGAQHTNSMSHFMDSDIFQRKRYQATSILAPFLPESLPDRERYLELPKDFSPRIRELVAGLTQGKSRDEQVTALLRFLKFGDYKYSLKGLPATGNPLEEFLFEYKYGNCEYFASAMAVMLRMIGIPARLVGGYKGGIYNNAGSYYLVLQKNAHVWVELYADGRGWARMDPTSPTAAPGSFGFDYYWYKFVIGYDLNRQLLILQKIRSGVRNPDFSFHIDRAALLRSGKLFLLFPLVAALVYRMRAGRRTREQQLIDKFLKRMAARGFAKAPSEGLEEFVARVEPEELQVKAQSFIAEFEQLYYRDHAFSPEAIRRFEQNIREL